MEHAGEEFDCGRFVGVGFVKGEEELEGAVFKGSVSYIGSNVDSVGCGNE